MAGVWGGISAFFRKRPPELPFSQTSQSHASEAFEAYEAWNALLEIKAWTRGDDEQLDSGKPLLRLAEEIHGYHPFIEVPATVKIDPEHLNPAHIELAKQKGWVVEVEGGRLGAVGVLAEKVHGRIVESKRSEALEHIKRDISQFTVDEAGNVCIPASVHRQAVYNGRIFHDFLTDPDANLVRKLTDTALINFVKAEKGVPELSGPTDTNGLSTETANQTNNVHYVSRSPISLPFNPPESGNWDELLNAPGWRLGSGPRSGDNELLWLRDNIDGFTKALLVPAVIKIDADGVDPKLIAQGEREGWIVKSEGGYGAMGEFVKALRNKILGAMLEEVKGNINVCLDDFQITPEGRVGINPIKYPTDQGLYREFFHAESGFFELTQPDLIEYVKAAKSAAIGVGQPVEVVQPPLVQDSELLRSFEAIKTQIAAVTLAS